MKIREMSKEQRNEYYKNKVKEWRLNNPKKNKELRRKYKQSEKGKIANARYSKKYFREQYIKNPGSHKQSKEYIKNYLKEYNKNQENHRKYLIRQKDNHGLRNKLLNQFGSCQLCGSKINLEIHHKTYDESKDVILLCRICHKRLHRKIK